MNEIGQLSQTELTELEAEDFSPEPSPLLESNRSLGYSFEEAISDLIDNSITAESSFIQVKIEWNSGVPFLEIFDDGKGMDLYDLVKAFKLGSKNPREERNPLDLGRFGFGLKTASISQARRLTVSSKKIHTNEIFTRCLDLDFIEKKKKWLLMHDLRGLHAHGHWKLVNHGTIVRWDLWDRVPKGYDDFITLTAKLVDYVSVCFHRFLESRKLNIEIQGIKVKPVSPIPETSQKYSLTKLGDTEAYQEAFILQHPHYWEKDFNEDPFINSYRLFEGLERQQGIYIYRCGRLLTPNGGWLGVIRPNNSAKLARVVIDYPNNTDHLWGLDITKTNAEIPYIFKEAIEDLVNKTKFQSIGKINRRTKVAERKIRGKIGDGLFWKESIHPELRCWKYTPNINHPVFRMLISDNIIDEKNLKLIFRLLSENLPVARIIENNDEDPGKHDRMERREKLTDSELKIGEIWLNTLMTKLTKAEAFDELIKHEPWCYFQNHLKEKFL